MEALLYIAEVFFLPLYQLPAIYIPFSSRLLILPWLRFLPSPSPEFDMTKISHSISQPAADFLPVLHTRAETIYGSPWEERYGHTVALTNPQMHLFLFFPHPPFPLP